MKIQPDTTIIAGRYLLHDRLGVGGMGVVYRATDRLSGETVALKRVTAPTEQLQFGSRGDVGDDSDALRLVLANEFQILASLRHPHIISVLDYGFDAERRPYFTMEYLDEAQTILEVGGGQSVSARVDLLIQVLQALAYLHRRGILHRDLKSANVLVVEGTVRVLDFGLSVTHDEASGTAGTFTHMAPEVLRGEPARQAADLYSLGVIAYELLAGCHPFGAADTGQLIWEILHSFPDLAALETDGRLASVIDRLLEKEPAARYPSADACIAAFCRALGQPLPQESIAIRESYLQAARFVGREKEMAQLTGALERVIAGRGSAWLVGGESGVGKSRLLDELRTRALVKGVLVLQGQGASEGGGASYQFWREPLRRLALATESSDLEAGSLKPIVPDISALLGRRIPDAPEMEGQTGRQRLLNTIGRIFGRQSSPVLLILEDLHWAIESLDILQQLNRMVARRPLLIVGSYREDEMPDLLTKLPAMQVITLGRLSAADVAKLSRSILGASGGQPKILDLLQRETEGNAFFLVEVVRALAEEAGRLSEVATMTLPAQVFPQGVQTIVRQRLTRVPTSAQALLRLAAVAGRRLDLLVITRLNDGRELDEWLTTCANAAVLEVHDGRWHFAHDKLREGLLVALDVPGRTRLHRQVAQAIEQTYPHDPEQAAALAYHWGMVGDAGRERRYARVAGEYAAARFANAAAILHFSRALDLTPEDNLIERYALFLAREKVYDFQGERKAQERDLVALESLAESLSDDRRRAIVALRQAQYAQVTGAYPAAISAAQKAISLAQATQDMNNKAAGYLQWGRALQLQGDYAAARSRLEQALVLAHAAQPSEPHRRVEANILRVFGNILAEQGSWVEARTRYEQALTLYRKVGARQGESIALSNLGYVSEGLGDYARANEYYEQALLICREIGDRRGEGETLVNQSLLFHRMGDGEAAREYSQQGLFILRDLGDRHFQGYALTFLGHALADLGRLEEAANAYAQALGVRQELGQPSLAMEPLAGLTRVLLAQGNVAQANSRVEEILDFLKNNSLDGTEEPLRVYHTCYRVLSLSQDSRAPAVLGAAYRMLQERAAKISDEELRHSFLENVAVHREIIKLANEPVKGKVRYKQ